MIRLSSLNDKSFVLNALLIETVEEVPHTVVTLTSGKKYVVKEGMEEVQQRVLAFLRHVGFAAGVASVISGGDDE